MVKIGLVYLVIISSCYLLLAFKQREKTKQSLKIVRKSLVKMVPFLLAIFGLIGLFQEFVSPATISAFFSQTKGLTALLISTIVGAVSIGPPLAAYPLAQTLLVSGAWPPAVAAFIFSWISIGIITLPFEASIFSLRFALLRNGISFIAAMVAGLLLGLLL